MGLKRSTQKRRLLLSLAVLFVGSRSWTGTGPLFAAGQNLVDGECVTDFDPDADVDYFPDKTYPDLAELFNVTYFGHYKIVEDYHSNSRIVLWQCGTSEPSAAASANFSTSVPISGALMDSSVALPLLNMLGERTSLKAYIGNLLFVTDPCVKQLEADGEVVEPYFSVENDTCFFSRLDNDMIEDVGVDVSFTSSPITTNPCGDDLSPTEPLLNRVSYSERFEAGEYASLKAVEWLKYFSYFYNKEARAEEVYGGIEQRWECTSSNALLCNGQAKDIKQVAWLGYYNWNDTVDGNWNPPEEDTYYHEAITASGGEMVPCTATVSSSFGGGYMSDDEMVECYAKADVCIFAVTDWDSMWAEKEHVLRKLRCIKLRTAFDVVGNSATDWFESRKANPDVLLEDMVMALHRDNDIFNIGDHERVYLRRVMGGRKNPAEEVGIFDGECADVDQEWVTRANACTLREDLCES